MSANPVFHGTILPVGFPAPPAGWVYDWKMLPVGDGKTQLYSYACSKGEVYGVKGAANGHRAILIIHGFGEHSGRYLHFPHFLGDVAETVYGFDLRGHGRSEGLRGHADRFDTFVDDAKAAVMDLHQKLMEKHGKAEIHLFGHSMGGHIGLRLLLLCPDLPVASASISAPFLGMKEKAPATKVGAASVLAATGFGWIQLDTGLDAALVSRDGAVVEAYRQDRLVHGKMTPRLFSQILKTIADTFRRDSGIKVPLQMYIPLQDGLVDPEKSLAYYRLLKVREKSLKTYPGYFHESFNDTGKEAVFSDISAWIRTHST